MKQQCHVSFVYASYLILLCGLVYLLIRGAILIAVVWVAFIALFLWLYIRCFPAISRIMGYGSVADQPAENIQPSHARVVLYTGLGCPFCPLMKKRLEDLRQQMGFELTEVDITLKPDLLVSKGIYSVPVVEIGEARWIGNATSGQLAVFITEHAGSK
jgi:glutaredoxin